jgi:hypothetical protein
MHAVMFASDIQYSNATNVHAARVAIISASASASAFDAFRISIDVFLLPTDCWAYVPTYLAEGRYPNIVSGDSEQEQRFLSS